MTSPNELEPRGNREGSFVEKTIYRTKGVFSGKYKKVVTAVTKSHTNLMTIDTVEKQSIKFDRRLMHSLKRVDLHRLVKWLKQKKKH